MQFCLFILILSKTSSKSPFHQILCFMNLKADIGSQWKIDDTFIISSWIMKGAKLQRSKSQTKLFYPKHPISLFRRIWANSISVLNPRNFVCLCVCFLNSQQIFVILPVAILITTHNTWSLWCIFINLVCLVFKELGPKKFKRINGPNYFPGTKL